MGKKTDLSGKNTSQGRAPQSFHTMLERVQSCKNIKHRFICAGIVYKEFGFAISKSEESLRERITPRFEDHAYTALCDFVLEALWCSEHIHYQLCLKHKDVELTPNKKRLRTITEKWAKIHFRLWVLCLNKKLI